MNKRDLRLLSRILASSLALVLALSMPAGTTGARAEDGNYDVLDLIDTGDDIPDNEIEEDGSADNNENDNADDDDAGADDETDGSGDDADANDETDSSGDNTTDADDETDGSGDDTTDADGETDASGGTEDEDQEAEQQDELSSAGLLPVNPTLLPLPLTDSFSQFVKSGGATLLDADQKSLPEAPETVNLDFDDTIYLMLQLEVLDHNDLQAIKLLGTQQYKVNIPEYLKGHNGEYPFNVAGGGKLGTLYIDNNGAYFVFNTTNKTIFPDTDNDPVMLRNLWLDVWCTLDEGLIGNNLRNIDINLDPYDEDKTYNIGLNGNTPTPPSMKKEGEYEPSTGLYEWTLEITAPDTTDSRDWLKDIVFTDVTGSNHTVWGDVKVTGKKVIGSTVQQDASTDTFGPDKYVKNDTGFTLSLAGTTYTGDITATYYTTLTKEAFENTKGESYIDLPNDASLTWDGNSKGIKASAELSKVNNSLMKKDGKFIPGKQAIEWTVTVDTLGQGYSYLTLYDLMSGGLKHDPNTIMVNNESVTLSIGNFYPDKNAAGDEVAGTEIMKLPLIVDGNNPYGNIITITYLTPIDNIDYHSGKADSIENIAWLEYGWKGGPGEGDGNTYDRLSPVVTKGTEAVSAPVIKNAVGYNPQTRLITWEIIVNSNCLDLTNVAVTDTVLIKDDQNGLYNHGSLAFVPNSFKINGVSQSDSSLTINGNVFNLPNLTQEASFKVTTEITDERFLTGNKENAGTFKNKIAMTAMKGETPVVGEDTAEIKPDNDVLKKEAGEYDYAAHTMEWTITVNEDMIDPFKDAVIMDTIPADQALVGAVTQISINSTGILGTVTRSMNDNVFTINLGDISGQTVTIKYETKLVNPPKYNSPEIVFNNNAKLTSEYADCEVNPEKTVTNIMRDKECLGVNKPDSSTALISYQVRINQGGDTIPAGGATLTDTMSIGMEVDTESVMLYNAIIGADGSFTKGGAIALGAVTFTKNLKDSTLTVTIPAGTKVCILEYDVIVRKNDGSAVSGDVTNTIKFEDKLANGSDDAGSTVVTNLDGGGDSGGNLDRYIKVNITKKDEKPQAYQSLLSGAEFELYLNDGVTYTPVAKATTNASGVAVFNLLMPSYVTHADYWVKELTAPNGYKSPSAGYIQVERDYVDGGGTVNVCTLNLSNERETNTVQFGKVNWEGKLTEGARFNLTDVEDNTVAARTLSDANGIFALSDITWGTYMLEEITTLDGHVPTGKYKLEIGKDWSVKITPVSGSFPKIPVTTIDGVTAIVNEKGSVTITKIDSETKNPITQAQGSSLVGAEFKLYKKGAPDTLIGTKTTGSADGKVIFDGLDYGETYIIKEESAPTGYILGTPAWSQEFIIGLPSAGKQIHYAKTVENEREGMYSFSFVKHAYNASGVMGSVGAGAAEFKLYKQSDSALANPVGSAVSTDSNGIVTFTGIPFGDYYIVETKAPAGHVLPSGKVMSVKLERSLVGNAPTVTITDLRSGGGAINSTTNPFKNVKGSFTITKRDNLYRNTNLADAVFQISPKRAGKTEPDTVTVGSNGTVKVEGLDIGTEYTFTEIAAPVGYQQPPVDSSLSFKFKPTDSKPDGVMSDATGITTASNGVVMTTAVYNNRTLHGFSFTKYGEDGKTIKDAVFSIQFDGTPTAGGQTVTDDTGYLSNVTSDGNGAVTLSGLPWGSYIVTEVTAPDGYRKNTAQIKFTIDKDGNITSYSGLDKVSENDYRFTNYLGSFTVTKKDAVSGDAMPDVEFEVYEKSGGDYVRSATHPLLYKTGTNGKVTIDKLYLGVEYQLREKQAPDGYTDPENYVTFMLTDGDTANEGTTYAKSGDYENYREQNYSFGFKKQDNNGNALNGAQFGLFSDPSCNKPVKGFSVEGKPLTIGIYQDAQSSANGGAVKFENLPFGTYYVKELAAPSGGEDSYNKSDVTLTVEIRGDGSYSIGDGAATHTSVTANTVSNFIVQNELLGSFTITKTDAFDGSPMGNVGFTLYKKVNGQKDTQPAQPAKSTSSGGIVKFTGLTLGQTYIVEETTVPTGFEKSLDFEVTPAYSSNPASYRIEETIENHRLGIHSFRFWKADTFRDSVKGAVFGIKRVAENASLTDAGIGINFTPDSEVTSETDGKVKFEYLKSGTYFVREISAPDGYAKIDTILKVVIGERDTDGGNTNAVITKISGAEPLTAASDGDILAGTKSGEKVLINENTGSLKITKVDEEDDSIVVPGAVFYLYKCDSAGGNRQYVESQTTGANGECAFKGLALDQYYVAVEYSVGEAYIANWSSGAFSIEKGASKSATEFEHAVEAENKRASVFSFGFKKQDNYGNALSGAKFGLYYDEACTDEAEDSAGAHITATSVSGSGNVVFRGLSFRTYYVKEMFAPLNGLSRYVMSDVVLKADIKSDGSYSIGVVGVSAVNAAKGAVSGLVVKNELLGSVTVVKQDKFGGKLGGVEFMLYDAAGTIAGGPAKTDANGVAVFTGLTLSKTYTLRESAPPQGYLACADINITPEYAADPAKYHIKQTVTNIREGKYSLDFLKQDSSGGALGGAVFGIIQTPDNADIASVGEQFVPDNTAVSEENGTVKFTGLGFGRYFIREMSAPAGYAVCDTVLRADIGLDGSVVLIKASGSDVTVSGNKVVVINKPTAAVTLGFPSGGGSGGKGSSGSPNRGSPAPDPTLPVAEPKPSANIPTSFPEGSTSTKPVTVEDTGDYTVTRQTVTTPDGYDHDVAAITVKNPDGARVGEIPPPPPRDDGYAFEGWYLDPEMTIPYRPGDKLPQGTVNLYAKWYLGVKSLDNDNPSTGDDFPYKPVSVAAVMAFLATISTCFTFRKKA